MSTVSKSLAPLRCVILHLGFPCNLKSPDTFCISRRPLPTVLVLVPVAVTIRLALSLSLSLIASGFVGSLSLCLVRVFPVLRACEVLPKAETSRWMGGIYS